MLAGDAESAKALVGAAWQNGVRFFDTAPFYGHGLSEMRLGAALGYERRAQATLCTKVGIRLLADDVSDSAHLHRVWTANAPLCATPAYDAAGIRRCMADSLQRLACDRVDIALLHGLTVFPEAAKANLPDTCAALAGLREAGLARRVGYAVNSVDEALALMAVMRPDVLLLATGLGISATVSALPLIEACQRRAITVIAAAPFAGGTMFSDDSTPLARLCRDYDLPVSAAALQYPLRSGVVETVLPATRSPDRLKAMVSDLRRVIPDAFWHDLRRAGIGPFPA